MRHLLAILCLLCLLLTGCGDEDAPGPRARRPNPNDKMGGIHPDEAVNLDLANLDQAIADAVKGVELVEREFSLNTSRDAGKFRMMVPKDTKEGSIGGLSLDDGNHLSLSVELHTGRSPNDRSTFDRDHVAAQIDNLVIFQDDYETERFYFRMVVPLGHLQLYGTRGYSEKVKPTLRNNLIAIHCLRTAHPSMTIESDPIEAMRQLEWRVIERDGKVTEIHIDPEGYSNFVTADSHKLLWPYKDLERLTFPLMSDDLCVELAKLTKLTHLHISASFSGRELTGKSLATLASLRGLRGLTVNGLHLKDGDLEPLAALTELEQLRLYVMPSSQITAASLAPLGKLTRLTDLHIGSPVANDEAVTHLRALTALRKFGLPGGYSEKDPRITDASLDTLLTFKELRELDLDGCALTDAGVLKLAGLGHLRKLNIYGAKIEDETVEKLKETLPKIKVRK